MAIIDITIIFILVLSTLVGLFRGFIKEILSLISWLLAFWVAYNYVIQGAVYLESYVQQQSLRYVAAFSIIFIASLLLISLASYVVYRSLSVAGISGVDRSLGTLFGFVRGVLVVSILILSAFFMDFNTQPWWKESTLIGYFAPVNNFIISLLPVELQNYVSTTLD